MLLVASAVQNKSLCGLSGCFFRYLESVTWHHSSDLPPPVLVPCFWWQREPELCFWAVYLPRAPKLWKSNWTDVMLQLGAEVVSEQSGAGAAALALLWSTERTPPPAAATPGRGLTPSAPRRHLLYGVLGLGVTPAVFAIGWQSGVRHKGRFKGSTKLSPSAAWKCCVRCING